MMTSTPSDSIPEIQLCGPTAARSGSPDRLRQSYSAPPVMPWWPPFFPRPPGASARQWCPSLPPAGRAAFFELQRGRLCLPARWAIRSPSPLNPRHVLGLFAPTRHTEVAPPMAPRHALPQLQTFPGSMPEDTRAEGPHFFTSSDCRTGVKLTLHLPLSEDSLRRGILPCSESCSLRFESAGLVDNTSFSKPGGLPFFLAHRTPFVSRPADGFRRFHRQVATFPLATSLQTQHHHI